MDRNVFLALTVSTNYMKSVGWWAPRNMTIFQNIIHRLYFVLSFMFLLGMWMPDNELYPKTLYKCYTVLVFLIAVGVYVIIQVVDLFMIWGDLPLMTGTAFLLFTNLAQTIKVFNVVWRKEEIQRIIDEGDKVLRSEVTEEGKLIVQRSIRETTLQQVLFFILTTVTVAGWAGSAEKNQLPMRAWYPYDTSRSPAYELTYCHQVGALFLAAYLNVAKDTLVTTLTAQCRCRLQLVNLTLRKLHADVEEEREDKNKPFTPEQEAKSQETLRQCAVQHQATLRAVDDLQRCFSAPTFAQFTVSLVIICVTAFQMASQHNPVRLASMTTYLLNMSYQVFIYCYQGEQLSAESTNIAGAAYECKWYKCSIPFRRSLLNVMVRSRRPAVLNAGGFTNLSLQSFMGIIKASYSFFTVLQQVNAET